MGEEEILQGGEMVKMCDFCKGDIITLSDPYIFLGSYLNQSILDIGTYYHPQCWKKINEKSINEEAQKSVKEAQKKAIGMMGGLLQNIGNIGQSIVDADANLSKQIEGVESGIIVKDKNDHGRNKKRKTKKKKV